MANMDLTSVVVEAQNVWMEYTDIIALREVSLKVREGEIKVLFGPSGSGKSTFLRCIAMLTPPTRGQVFLRGEDLTNPVVDINAARAKIGFVFQNIVLFHHLRALGNVTLGLRRVLGMSKEEAHERAMQALREVRMERWIDHYPAELSGGQQQRVGIARALAMDPEIILFDEPTSSLDPELKGEVLDTMKELGEKGRTMLVATHEMHFAEEVADEMIFLDEGQLIEQGSPEHFFTNPSTKRARQFLARLIREEG